MSGNKTAVAMKEPTSSQRSMRANTVGFDLLNWSPLLHPESYRRTDLLGDELAPSSIAAAPAQDVAAPRSIHNLMKTRWWRRRESNEHSLVKTRKLLRNGIR